MRISTTWRTDILELLDAGQPIDRTISFNKATQWLIMTLSQRGVAFKLINLGAGVKRITTETDVCPKCNGTGRC